MFCFYSTVLVFEGIETATWSDSTSQNERRNTSNSSSWEGSGTQMERTEMRNGMKSWNCSQSDEDDT